MNGDQLKGRSTKLRNWRRNDLAYERRARKLSLKEAAELLGISLKTLDNYERGRYMPSVATALKLQILYRGQIASFYQSLYASLTAAIRAAESRNTGKRGDA
jgi:transcriptional regulator with XRE-family HTH domain